MNPEVCDFLAHLGRGGYGYFWTVSPDGFKKITKAYDIHRAMPSVSLQDDVYFAVHPVNRLMGYKERGRDDAVCAMACLYAEFDGKDEVSTTDIDMQPWLDQVKAGKKVNTSISVLTKMAEELYKEEIFLADRLSYLKLAANRIKGLTLKPSYIVYSGGGYHLYWLLNEPFVITDTQERLRATQMQYDWVTFVGGDPSCKDLKRVLRLPNTWNYKKKYGQPQPVAFVPDGIHPERTYLFDELEEISAPILFQPPVTKPEKPVHQRHDSIYSQEEVSQDLYDFTLTVIAAFNARYTSEDILNRNQYTQAKAKADRFDRPGGKTQGVWIGSDTGRVYSFSENDPLFHDNYGGTGAHDAYSLFVELECEGNTKVARAKVAKEFGLVRKRPTLDLSKPTTQVRVADAIFSGLF